jgi:predicted O-methyltransferase YrrM
VGRVVVSRPGESIEHVRERVSEWRDGHRPPWPYEATEAGEERMHELIDAPWPCDERREFQAVWDAAVNRVRTRGLQVGRVTFGRWDDGDVRLGRLAWCLARHLRPQRVVETGVGRGFTTSALLDALDRNGGGRLWSIDLPPLARRDFAEDIGAAVPERLHERWTLLRGSSRRLLPRLLADLGEVDLFVHDSMHTSRNMRFELEQAWAALCPGGAALVDDVEKNVATGQFLGAHEEAMAVLSTADDGAALIGCLAKRP